MRETWPFRRNPHPRAYQPCLHHELILQFAWHIFASNQILGEWCRAYRLHRPSNGWARANLSAVYGAQPLNQNPKRRGCRLRSASRTGTSYRVPTRQSSLRKHSGCCSHQTKARCPRLNSGETDVSEPGGSGATCRDQYGVRNQPTCGHALAACRATPNWVRDPSG